MRKKPVYTKLNAHGSHSRIKCNNEDLKQTAFQEETNQNCDSTCGWITSLAALPYSDLFASGSGDGYVRLWKLSETKKSFVILNCIPAVIIF